VREYTRETDLLALIDQQRYQPARQWLERELVKIPCRCPACNRRTDLSRMPDVGQAIAETRIARDLLARHGPRRLKEIIDFLAEKLATRDGAFLVCCDRCTLADLHRLNNPQRIDYYKKKPRKRALTHG
jgi:hypothetical protein